MIATEWAPAQAATWTYIGAYPSESACVNAGVSYQRQGWDAFKCVLIVGSRVDLWGK